MIQDISVDFSCRIPNNVGLRDDPEVRVSMEEWHRGYMKGSTTVGFTARAEGVFLAPTYTGKPRTFSCNSISCNSSRARSRPARPLLGLFE